MSPKTWVRRLFPAATRRPARARLGLDGLGDRTLMSVTPVLAGGTLSVTGDGADDFAYVFRVADGQPRAGEYAVAHPGGTAYFGHGVSRIVIDGGGGDDWLETEASVPITVPCVIRGGDGNDRILSGGHGDDELFGGAGDDTYEFFADGHLGTDRVEEEPGQGADTLDYRWTTAAVSVDLRAGHQRVKKDVGLHLPYANTVENVRGGSGGDTLTGNDLANDIRGGAGQDTIHGWNGSDALYGEGWDDRLNGGFGDDALDGGAGSDRYVFDSNRGEGYDRVTDAPEPAPAGGWRLGDTLDFSGNYDGVTVSLGAAGVKQQVNSWHAVYVDGEVENVEGTQGDDRLTGTDAKNRLIGHRGNDGLDGRAGDDFLAGYDGNDSLYGGLGADSLYGGSGNDFLHAGGVGSAAAGNPHYDRNQRGPSDSSRDYLQGDGGMDWYGMADSTSRDVEDEDEQSADALDWLAAGLKGIGDGLADAAR